ncbi:MAG: tripartite tricarboxylate transporter substrate binding protein [Hyphomicrobiaceae bacterium]|nr:tripartite tricarboxylate transporter substrate binding protein [Hyphomicrobiaceae bacterium]
MAKRETCSVIGSRSPHRRRAEKLQVAMGQPVIVENRPGAGGSTAAAYVKSLPADGYNLLVGASGAMVIASALAANVTYDTLADFEPISVLGTFPVVLIVAGDSPHKTVKDLAAWSIANPSLANYASVSPTFTLAAELYKLKTGAPMQRVSYRGSADAVVAVMSKQVTAAVTDTLPAIPLIKDGQVRALAVTAASRLAALPDVPTMEEAGVGGAEATFWTGLFAPKGTPGEVIRMLQAQIKTAMTTDDVRQRLAALATEAATSNSEQFAERIRGDLEKWTSVAKAAKVRNE